MTGGKKKTSYVLSLGGSVFAPNGKKKGIDFNYIQQFERFIRKQIAKNRRFFIMR